MKNKPTKTRKNQSRAKSAPLTDVPPRAIHTYTTASCPTPRVTDACVVRALGHTTVAAQAVSGVAQSLNFTLASSSLTAGQWDQYKLLAVRVTISPDQNAVGLFTNSANSYTPLYTVVDYDDATNLTSVGQAEAYNNCIVLGAGESCSRLFRPRMALAAYSGAFTGFANTGDLWLDAASTTVQHYGVKIYIPGATAAQVQLPSWQISTEYFFAFRKSI
jgi:hypothetical protein